MSLDKFAGFAYDVLYGEDEYKYIRVSNTSDGMRIGVLNWTGCKAINILQSIVATLGPIKSTLILGRKLRHKILNPYVEWGVVKSDAKLTNGEIDKISRLLNTRDGMSIQNTHAMLEITSHIMDTTKTGITNYGIVTFMVSQYINWTPRFSEDVIAICRMYGKGQSTSLCDLEPHLQTIFSRECLGKQTKTLFYKIMSYVDNIDNID